MLPSTVNVEFPNQIIDGMEVICPDGLGRLSIEIYRKPGKFAFRLYVNIYSNNRGCFYAPENLTFINPVTHQAFKLTEIPHEYR